MSSQAVTNGTLILATVGQGAPFNYVRDGQVIGLELDIAARFCSVSAVNLFNLLLIAAGIGICGLIYIIP